MRNVVTLQPARRLPAVLAFVLLLAACGGGGSSGKLASPTTTVAAPSNVYPLTGLPIDDAAKAIRPAVSIKIENEPPARPQSGLQDADVVYETLIEGGDTRFVAIFQSTDAEPAGSIRSVRPTDPDIVAPIGGLFAYSGGTPKFIDALHAVPVVDVGQSTHEAAYFNRSDKSGDHKLFSSTERLYAAGQGSTAKAPPPIFTFVKSGAAFEGAGIVPATHVDAVVGNQKLSWEWNSGKGWLRSINGRPHTVEGGEQIAATNVIVQSVAWLPSDGDVDTAGSQVYVAQMVGSGDVLVASDGKVVKGKWSKPSTNAITTYTDAAGKPIALKPGRTWIELSGNDQAPTVR
ncbi:MAG TPA: DUF3048 domain-containing protein [Acidimicrobiales bacterium]|nr:DUF3048 domain-containing protein [Acidimicrobiales bacterium]